MIRAAVAVSALALVAACGGSGEDSGGSGTSAEELTVYSALNPEVSEAILAAFKDEHPDIKVNYLRLSTGPLTVRYQQEQEAGVVAADIMMAADKNFFTAGNEQGWFADLPGRIDGIEDWPEEALTEDSVIKLSTAPAGVNYNSNLVKGDDIPDSWDDLLDPKFKGKILLADPRTVPTNLFLLTKLGEEYGEDFLTGLRDQDLKVVPSAVPGSQQLAAGEASLLFPNIESVTKALKDQGAPVETVILEPTTGFEMYMGVSEKAKRPEAADLFTEFMITEKGQAALNAAYLAISPLGDVEGSVEQPADFFVPDFSVNAKLGPQTLKKLGLPAVETSSK